MRRLIIIALFLAGCSGRGVNGPCGFIGPNGSYIPCSSYGTPYGMWATREPARNHQKIQAPRWPSGYRGFRRPAGS